MTADVLEQLHASFPIGEMGDVPRHEEPFELLRQRSCKRRVRAAADECPMSKHVHTFESRVRGAVAIGHGVRRAPPLAFSRRNPGQTSIGQFQTSNLQTIREDASIEDALADPAPGPVPARIPVVDGANKLVGLLSLKDSMELLADELGKPADWSSRDRRAASELGTPVTSADQDR